MIMKRMVLAALAAGIWINVSEFVRNELLFKHHWVAQYEALGLEFPSTPVNGALWALWGFIFAACIVTVRRRTTCAGTIALCWTLGFVLMWIVIGNLNVLPVALLPIAVPWSLAEVVLAVVLAQWIMKTPELNNAIDADK
jgi:hypothetical protein